MIHKMVEFEYNLAQRTYRMLANEVELLIYLVYKKSVIFLQPGKVNNIIISYLDYLKSLDKLSLLYYFIQYRN